MLKISAVTWLICVLTVAGCAHQGSRQSGLADVSDGSEGFWDSASYGDFPGGSSDGNLWKRIAGNLEFANLEHPRISAELTEYKTYPTALQAASKRARPFLYLIYERTDKRGMPADLALLPVVESQFKARARSRRSALGIWQFMPATGRHYGLAQNWWYDGRLDVNASTNAALDFLQYLHRKFDGDWLLALAAYNAGEGTVRRAMRRNRSAGRPTDFWSLKLPRETRKYVPRLIAVAKIVKRPGAYGIALAPIPDRPLIARVPTSKQIDLALAAQAVDMQTDELMLLNAGFRRGATAPDGPHHLLVPADRADKLRSQLGKLAPRQQQSAGWKRHRIQRGETLVAIARKHGSDVESLRQANNLSGSHIRAGDQLLIPVAGSGAKSAQITRTADISETGEATRGADPVRYRVRRGDSLFRISRRFQVSITDLRKWNGLGNSSHIKIGQTLLVYV